PGAADNGDVQWRRRAAVEERADLVPDQGGGEPELARLAGQSRLPAAMVFQPGEVAGQQTDKLAVIGGVHPPRPGNPSFYPMFHDRNAVATGGPGTRSARNASTGSSGCRPRIRSAMIRPVAGESWIPARKWPAATNAFSQPGIGPRNGIPS